MVRQGVHGVDRSRETSLSSKGGETGSLCGVSFPDFRLTSYCFQIYFRLVVWKIIKTSDFRLVQIGSDWLFRFQIGLWDYRLDSDRLQIGFRFISDCSLEKPQFYDFILVQIGSCWLQNEPLWIFVEISPFEKIPRKCGPIFLYIFLNILSIFDLFVNIHDRWVCVTLCRVVKHNQTVF